MSCLQVIPARGRDLIRIERMVPMLSVRDLAKTIAFYCDDLGFRCVRTAGSPKPVWCHVARDGVALMFNQPPEAEFSESHERARDFQVFYFYPNDVAALHADLTARRIPTSSLRMTDYGMQEFELRDPDGYWLWFGQSMDGPARARE